MTSARTKRIVMVITVALAAVIGVLTLLPLELPPGPPGNDKLYHFIAFMALAAPISVFWRAAVPYAAPVFVIYGGAIELIQPHVGRSAEWADFGMDVLGVMAAIALGALVLRIRKHGVASRA